MAVIEKEQTPGKSEKKIDQALSAMLRTLNQFDEYFFDASKDAKYLGSVLGAMAKNISLHANFLKQAIESDDFLHQNPQIEIALNRYKETADQGMKFIEIKDTIVNVQKLFDKFSETLYELIQKGGKDENSLSLLHQAANNHHEGKHALSAINTDFADLHSALATRNVSIKNFDLFTNGFADLRDKSNEIQSLIDQAAQKIVPDYENAEENKNNFDIIAKKYFAYIKERDLIVNRYLEELNETIQAQDIDANKLDLNILRIRAQLNPREHEDLEKLLDDFMIKIGHNGYYQNLIMEIGASLINSAAIMEEIETILDQIVDNFLKNIQDFGIEIGNTSGLVESLRPKEETTGNRFSSYRDYGELISSNRASIQRKKNEHSKTYREFEKSIVLGEKIENHKKDILKILNLADDLVAFLDRTKGSIDQITEKESQ